MDRRIEEMLEDYLHGSLTAERDAEFRRALESADAETRQMVAAFSRHSQLIRQAFGAPEVAPAAGFYARVVERIDSQRVTAVSFWDAFLEPHFFKRVAFAALTLLMLLSVTMLTTPAIHEEVLAEAPVVQMASDPDPIQVTGVSNQESNRDAILVQLATYQE
ncbi:MAG: hypothetical protein IT168_04565 [Bryobacterales bacterium]|nr:hypothetical protein [Bryobacterales bacterium]